MPGNRAVAYGDEIDYALLHVEGLAEKSHLKIGDRLLVALPLLPQFEKDAGIGAHSIKRVIKGAELAARLLRIRCAAMAMISMCRCCR
jgi:isoleucyl-tRNA synthetase